MDSNLADLSLLLKRRLARFNPHAIPEPYVSLGEMYVYLADWLGCNPDFRKVKRLGIERIYYLRQCFFCKSGSQDAIFLDPFCKDCVQEFNILAIEKQDRYMNNFFIAQSFLIETNAGITHNEYYKRTKFDGPSLSAEEQLPQSNGAI